MSGLSQPCGLNCGQALSALFLPVWVHTCSLLSLGCLGDIGSWFQTFTVYQLLELFADF